MAGVLTAANFRFLFREDAGTINRRVWWIGTAALVLVQIAMLAYRYAFLFFAEARRVRIALRTRAFRPATNLRTYQTTGQAIGSLLLRGGDRAEQVADAMRTRGFDGRFHTIRHFRTTAGDVVLMQAAPPAAGAARSR